MKCTAILAAITAILGICVILEAQDIAPTHGKQVAAMKKLQPMLGEWKGDGWIEMGPRRFDFESSEVFAEKAGGLAIVVEGLHRMPMPDGSHRVVHNAVAMINFDAKAGRYRFITQLANGRAGDYEGTLTKEGDFRWVIPDTPLGKIVYTISIRNGEYRELGELISQAGDRKQFFEMKLKRAKP